MKETVRFRKSALTAIVFAAVCVSGCGGAPPEETPVEETAAEAPTVPEDLREDEEITGICLELYDKAAEENRMADLEMVRSIVNRFGENGYPAVDSKNQIDMAGAAQVEEFCEKADAREEAEVTILEVNYSGGFLRYDLHTEDGNVEVTRSYYRYGNGDIQRAVTGRYEAEYWDYTEEGYLMFSGVWFSEEQYVLTMSGSEVHTALRVQPLDETYRELGRKYLLPIGFGQNNMFISDWSEDDFGDLNFYDMYDILYPKVYGKYVSDSVGTEPGADAVRRIPADEFESVIMKYFRIDRETLQSGTVYFPEDSTYEYKPRGFGEAEFPEYPYSEVVDFAENGDGTITLTANVVFPYADDSRLYVHETVVRPLEDGGVQYVSNRIVPSEDNGAETWHTPRLTADG